MTSTTTTARRSAAYFSGYRLGAWAAHAGSWLTTYWLCAWVGDPRSDAGYALTVLLSLVIEFLILHKMKRLLFDSDARNDALGWAGFAIDSLINAGGAFEKTGRLASWPPLAALVRAFGAEISSGVGNTIAAFLLALALGVLLAVLPLRLDQRAAQG